MHKDFASVYPTWGSFNNRVKTEVCRWLKQKEKIQAAKPVVEPAEINYAEKIKAILKKRGVVPIAELSNTLDISYGKVEGFIKELTDKGHTAVTENGNVIFSTLIPKSEPTYLDVKKMSTGFHRFGVCGDNHLCSKYERLDILNALYDFYESEGITTVYNTGNWIDGEARFNKHDIHTHGMDNQIDYFLENYPKRKGITTYYITGDDHEGWYTQREGIDVGRYTEMKAKQAGREDFGESLLAPDRTHDRLARVGMGMGYGAAGMGMGGPSPPAWFRNLTAQVRCGCASSPYLIPQLGPYLNPYLNVSRR